MAPHCQLLFHSNKQQNEGPSLEQGYNGVYLSSAQAKPPLLTIIPPHIKHPFPTKSSQKS
jgi:hypothetical protein